MLNYIIWNFNPDIFFISWASYSPRWYGVLFALGAILSQQVMLYIFKQEGRPTKDIEKLTTYVVIATIVGARLGHCLFYDPVYFLSNPMEIIKIWKGGLASHGGAIGILVALYLFARKSSYSFLWLLDRVVIIAVLTGALIRTGNLANSEMEGVETYSNTGLIYARATYDLLFYDKEKIASIFFKKGGQMESTQPGRVPITAVIEYKEGVEVDLNEKTFIENVLRNSLLGYSEVVQHIDVGKGPLSYTVQKQNGKQIVEIYALGIVRHAAQMYEATYCVILMIVLFWLWKNKRKVLPRGFNFALLMIVLWALRFVDEYFKMNQEAFEDHLVLNMGQILSLPMIVAGIIMMIYAYQGKKTMAEF